MIQILVTSTGKGYSPKDTYRTFDQFTRNFSDMASAKAWVADTYGKAKRQAMYVDTKDGKAMRCGYVIGFRNCDISHYPVDKWLQQDWLEFREVTTMNLAGAR